MSYITSPSITWLIKTCHLKCLQYAITILFSTMYVHDVCILILSQKTDICAHALEALAESRIRRVDIIGRRGPLQVAFTIKELREMTRLPGCRPRINTADMDQARDLLASTSNQSSTINIGCSSQFSLLAISVTYAVKPILQYAFILTCMLEPSMHLFTFQSQFPFYNVVF